MKKVIPWMKANPHCLLLSFWIFYLIYFALLEKFTIPVFMIQSPIDELIPFNEYFIVPYLLWFPLLAGSLAYFLFHHKTEFQNLCFLMFTGLTIALLIYTFFPNGLELRIDITSTNIFANIVKAMQSIDSPTNVCPSMHVSSTLAILFVVLRYPNFKHPKLIKPAILLLSVLILLSTMFLKQHSIIDVAAAIVLSSALYVITYHTNWRKLFQFRLLRVVFES